MTEKRQDSWLRWLQWIESASVVCPRCGGSGHDPSLEPAPGPVALTSEERCHRCRGSGQLGDVVLLKAAAVEVRRLRAENERLKALVLVWNTGTPDDDREVLVARSGESGEWVEFASFRRDYGDPYMGIEGLWWAEEVGQIDDVKFWAEVPKFPEVVDEG